MSTLKENWRRKIHKIENYNKNKKRHNNKLTRQKNPHEREVEDINQNLSIKDDEIYCLINRNKTLLMKTKKLKKEKKA